MYGYNRNLDEKFGLVENMYMFTVSFIATAQLAKVLSFRHEANLFGYNRNLVEEFVLRVHVYVYRFIYSNCLIC